MGRPKEEHYWNQVRKLEDGRLECKHCGHKFKGGAARIKAHVDRKQGRGVTACSVDPATVPDNEGVDNSVTAGSSNPQGAMNTLQVTGHDHEMIDNNIAGSSNHQDVTHPFSLLEGWTAMDTMESSNSDWEHLQKLFHDLTCEEDDIKQQLQWLESHGKKRKSVVDDWLNAGKNLKRKCDDTRNLMDQGSTNFPDILLLTEEILEHKEQKPLVLSNELVGESFERNIKKMWELLGEDQVFIIGIHGMGGVGKTFLVTHMEREITRKGTFKHVFWVTVSQDFSIFKLQNDIAKRIGVKLDEDDERIRAAKLSLELEEKDKSVLILDDVWKNIDLQKVGIPLRVNGIKLILTSRLKHVCHQMDCSPNNIITMEPLSYEEAQTLFLLKLGYHGTPATLSPEVLKTARSIADKCYGLPLGICVMARTMKGVNNIHGWRHALNKLRNSAMGEEMEEEVFNVLKLSYDNLVDKNMQNYFLYSAIMGEGPFYTEDSREFVMSLMMLVDEGMINGMRSLEEMFDEGHFILDKLIDHSLLFREEDEIRMHDLVREMAWHILKGSHRCMIKRNEGLKEIPHMQEGTADLEKVSLIHNVLYYECTSPRCPRLSLEIPAGTSPRCPRLSSFIFGGYLLTRIPDCFFSHMNALAVLDLSLNSNLTCLPTSVSNLRSLISLLLEGCRSLEYVPPLGELHALSRLVISGTSIKEVPRGLEMLINLKWLDLSFNEKLTLLSGFVLRGLTNLQFLDLRCDTDTTEVKAEDVRGMSKLEYFAGRFSDSQDFNDFVRRIQETGHGPEYYILRSGTWFPDDDIGFRVDIDPWMDETVVFGDCEEIIHLMPRDLAKLYISHNEQWRCLCDALSFNAPSSLREIYIRDCPKLESLFCLSGSCSLCANLGNLESLSLCRLESLSFIWKENDADITPLLCSGGMFSNLTQIQISRCPNMKKLFTVGSLAQLKNLVKVQVQECYSMEKIFSEENTEGDSVITLPKLKELRLALLPQLNTVCRGILVCESSDILEICYCPKLEKLPVVKKI